MNNFIDTFLFQLSQTATLEYIAVIFGIISVYFAKKADILLYPTGIISVIIYVFICFKHKIYADMFINFYYFIMSIYGWYKWSVTTNTSQEFTVSWNQQKALLIDIGFFACMFLLIATTLIYFTDSDIPIWDALTTALFLVAMIQMAHKKIDNWVTWIIADLISIPLYFSKGLILTSFQYIIFTILAVFGLISWIKLERTQYESRNQAV